MKFGTKPKKKDGLRKGGHRPGAKPRKLLTDIHQNEGLSAMVKAANEGDWTKPGLERVLYAIAAARQFLSRSNTKFRPTPQLDSCPREHWATCVEFLTTPTSVIDELRSILADFVQVVTPQGLRALAALLEARPIVMEGGVRRPRAADPAIAALPELVMNAYVREGRLAFPSNMSPEELMKLLEPREILRLINDCSPETFENWASIFAPGSNKKTLRKMLNQHLGVKGKRGRPKKMR